MRARAILPLLFLLAVSIPVHAQKEKLAVGDQAPEISISTWVKGESTAITSGQVYLIEFWATWCGPCKRAMPHLSDLQEQYGSRVTVIGISTEELDVVKRFVRKSEVMNYTVAVDDNKATNNSWMKAAGKNGIPCTFVVDARGVIQYIGHPMDPDLEEILPLVIAGRYDAKLFDRSRATRRAADNARESRNWRMCMKHLDDIIALDPHIFASLHQQKFEIMLLDMDDRDAAYAYIDHVVQEYGEDADLLFSLATQIATDPGIPETKRDFPRAILIAEAAARLITEGDHRKYSVPAQVYFKSGDLIRAASLQRKAVRMASPRDKDQMQHDLESYLKVRRSG